MIVPPAVASDSHGAVSDAVQLADPLATVSVLAAGSAPPATPLNDSDDGVTVNVGPEHVTGAAMSAWISPAGSARL